SKELESEVLKHFPKPKVATIYRGVDLEEFGFVPKDVANQELKFLYLGGLSARKGNPFGMNLKGGITLLKAWKSFIDQNAGTGYTYSLQFGGPDVTQEKVENILGDSIAKYNIQLPGYLDKFSISKHMADATVVVVPSMAEGLPNVAMEAAATGCIVVGTKVGGIPEVVEDRETGYLFDAGDENSLTQVFNEISRNLDKLPQMTAKSRKRMESLFDSKSFAENYLKAYNTNG
ncbi:MAG: glycosyltransferase, partial [Chitinophagaceae bacterium]